MNKLLIALAFGAAPLLALASGDHAGGHNMGAQRAMPAHDMQSMHGDDHDDDHGNDHGGAYGAPGDPVKVSQTVVVTMDDTMRFNPDKVSVKAGETVRFFVKNAGKVPHEMVIGTAGELKAHAAMMRQNPGMQHAEPNMITLAPGQRGGLVWRFDKAGTVDFACLVPGHMEAGMVGKVEVGSAN